MQRGVASSVLVICCAGFPWIAGCSWGSAPEDEEVQETSVSELGDDSPPPGRSAVPAHAAIPQPAPGGGGTAPSLTPPVNAEQPSAARTHWPLVKTVVQELRQQTPDGWIDNRTVLELAILITRDDQRMPLTAGSSQGAFEGNTAFRVDFQQVRFTQELPGIPPLQFDSDAAQMSVPVAFQPLLGLKGNGFRFRMDRERQVTEVVGFDAFLDRCLAQVPPEQQAIVRGSIPAANAAECIAYFIDESIGMIPADVSHAGDNWLRSREVWQPVPCIATTRFTVRQVTAEATDFDMAGTIEPTPPSASTVEAAPGEMPVRITGGRLLGQCRIDRRSGIPLRSRREQALEMRVRTAEGSEFAQHKTTTTTVELHSAPRESAPYAAGSQRASTGMSADAPPRARQAPQPLTRRERPAELRR